MASPTLPPLRTLTLDQIAAGLDGGAFTVVQLVQAHLDQIKRFDVDLHAVMQVNPNALVTAERLDAELQASGRRGLLHGVPVLIKDNVVTHEPFEATSGSLALVGAKPARESPVAARLRAAGAVLLGSANCSEWANFRSRPSDSGWSARGGQTYGAYHESMDPGGSSSGSGVAVDMGFCVLAVGTETSGSIISPSTQNNIVGLKPTTGLVSRDAVIPISPEQDTPGPMARTLADAAAMLAVLAGRDEHDAKTSEIPFDEVPDYRAAASAAELDIRALRLAIPRNALADIQVSVLATFEERVVAPLRARGATIVDCNFTGLEHFRTLSIHEKTNYMAGEFHDALPEYLASLTTNPQHIDSFKALCEFIKATPGEAYGEEYSEADEDDKEADESKKDGAPRRNIIRLVQAMHLARNSPEFLMARQDAAYFAGPGGIQGALDGGDSHEAVDALLLPTDSWTANYFAACGGHPQITVPLGYRDAETTVKHNNTGRLVSLAPGMPIGVSIIGRKYNEEALLPICAAVEELAHAREEAELRRPSQLQQH